MEERLLFKLLQWAGIGVGEDTREESIQEEMMTRTMHRWAGGGEWGWDVIVLVHHNYVRQS